MTKFENRLLYYDKYFVNDFCRYFNVEKDNEGRLVVKDVQQRGKNFIADANILRQQKHFPILGILYLQYGVMSAEEVSTLINGEMKNIMDGHVRARAKKKIIKSENGVKLALDSWAKSSAKSVEDLLCELGLLKIKKSPSSL